LEVLKHLFQLFDIDEKDILQKLFSWNLKSQPWKLKKQSAFRVVTLHKLQTAIPDFVIAVIELPTARSKARVCGRWFAGIAVSNLAGDTDACPL
jgi:hypothetical protein